MSRRAAITLVVAVLLPGCMSAPYDGARVASKLAPVHFGGEIAVPGKSVQIRAYNFAKSQFDVVGVVASSTSPDTHLWGFDWYSWVADVPLGPSYWASGAAGSFARVEATSGIPLFSLREDAGACMGENSASLGGVVEECASHRSPSAFIYTADYQHGPPGCAAVPAVAKARYDVWEVPPCARQAIADLEGSFINRALIDTHWGINHDDPTGFFFGHRAFLRKMERHAMVYGEQWAPSGKLPSWDPSTPIPPELTKIQASPFACVGLSHLPNGKPNPVCAGGWSSVANATNDPKITLPSALQPANLCTQNPTLMMLHDSMHPWHDTVHATVGGKTGAFTQFDSPAAAVFWPFHSYVDDRLSAWEACSGG